MVPAPRARGRGERAACNEGKNREVGAPPRSRALRRKPKTRLDLNKHLSMLFAAAVALCASPAIAACPAATTCDDVTTVLTSPIQTQTAGPGGTPDNIFIESGGGVKV